MSDFLTDFTDQYLDVIEMNGESDLETTGKDMIQTFVTSAAIALRIQTAADAGDTEILAKVSALSQLALKFNKAFPDLSDSEQTEIENVVAGIVTGDDELDAEAWFNAVLVSIGKGQKYAKAGNALLANQIV